MIASALAARLAHAGRPRGTEKSQPACCLRAGRARQPHGIGHALTLRLAHLRSCTAAPDAHFSRSSPSAVDRNAVRRETICADMLGLAFGAARAARVPFLDELLSSLPWPRCACQVQRLSYCLRRNIVLLTAQLVQFGLQPSTATGGPWRQLHACGRLVEQVVGLVRQKRAVM